MRSPALYTRQGTPNLTVLGPSLQQQRRLAIFSFVINVPWSSTHFLHHSFVCALLNDLYGIQVLCRRFFLYVTLIFHWSLCALAIRSDLAVVLPFGATQRAGCAWGFFFSHDV